MTIYTLTLIETSGIQKYVFGSNNLTVNVGASELVDQVTRSWLVSALPQPHNLKPGASNLDEPEFIEEIEIGTQDVKAEVVYRGGGNALILFREREDAREFTRRLTTKALLDAPGLQLIAAHTEFNWETDSLHRVFMDDLRPVMARRKRDSQRSTPLPGLGVSAACAYTGQPAAHYERIHDHDPQAKLFSAEVNAKRSMLQAGQERLKNLFPELKAAYELVYDFNQLGTPGESSYLAVIHCDGNAMGERLGRYIEAYQEPEQNRMWIRKLRGFSERVKEVAMTALGDTLHSLIHYLDFEEQEEPTLDEGNVQAVSPVRIRVENGRRQLPFRPIIFGGDDVTFVSDGRLGLALAREYLARSAGQNLADGRPAYSRGGVAVVHSHFPFAQAYRLAEELTASSKKLPGYPEVCAMDWHFAVSGLMDDAAGIRRREYSVQAGSLLMRPVYVVDPGGEEWRTWDVFSSLVGEFQTSDEWRERRNKVKALREALRSGPDAVYQFRSFYNEGRPLPVHARLSDDMVKHGWSPSTGDQPGRCVYFDAVEAMDLFVALEERSLA